MVAKAWQCLGAVVLCTVALFSAANAAQRPPGPAIPPRLVPLMIAPEARVPVRLQKVEVQAEVLGTAAHTRIEMVFYNPNERVLEGELQFPLLDGQTVTGFALDIDGELRSAVVVDKAKGQQVFEDVIRTRVDPGLLEKTQGNNYKMRVYPLPAKGTRRVVLEFDEVLPQVGGPVAKGPRYTTYRLPLQFGETIGELDVAVHNGGSPSRYSAMAVRARLNSERLKVEYATQHADASGSSVRLSRKNYAGKGALIVEFPSLDQPMVATESRDGETYFYAEVALPVSKPAPRPAPARLGLVWDASGSGANRDHGREFALLDAYFKALGNTQVELVVARDRAEAGQSFSIKNGNWRELRTALENMVYDGATSVAALSPDKTANLTLLFTDGLCNYGPGGFVSGDAPVCPVSSSVSTDLPRLQEIAERTGGRFLDLQEITPEVAVKALTLQYPRLRGLRSNSAKELVSGAMDGGDNRVKIAGILTEPQGTVNLEWIDAQGKRQTQEVRIATGGQATTSLAANRWAALRIAQLEGDYAANRGAIRRLGTRFGLVTRETSLIILDRVEDYVRYEITPPESLRAAYDALLAQQASKRSDERSTHLEDIVRRFAEKVAWWEKEFPKGDKPDPKPVETSSPMGRWVGSAAPQEMGVAAAAAPQREERLMARAPRPSAPAAQFVVRPLAEPPQEARISLKKWVADAPYVKRLREAPPEEMYRIYLDERPAYLNSTAFFLDAADLFFERGQTELGLRILSNLAEMNLENRQILRILAYRLLQAKEAKQAVVILKQVLALSPNEPQSWRDLGLAQAEAGQYQEAVDNLWEVVVRPWHNRFPDVELIALAELNSIVARAPQGTVLDTSRMDARLVRNLPLDLRAVLSWDADNTDIDLHVIDPNGDEVYYGNRLSYQGGTFSRDFTGGYGPEEFSLRTAKPGTYKVRAQFYGNNQQMVTGSTTLMLRLSTGFGTPQQKEENIILRLSGRGSTVEVGTFEIGKAAQ